MFSDVCLIVSIAFLASSWNCHAAMVCSNEFAGYLCSPVLKSIPWISGYILAVIPECMLFNIKWYWMFLINVAYLLTLSKLVTILLLRMFATGRGNGADSFLFIVIGLIALILGAIF